jgi:hypothetical protein
MLPALATGRGWINVRYQKMSRLENTKLLSPIHILSGATAILTVGPNA